MENSYLVLNELVSGDLDIEEEMANEHRLMFWTYIVLIVVQALVFVVLLLEWK